MSELLVHPVFSAQHCEPSVVVFTLKIQGNKIQKQYLKSGVFP